MRRAVALIAVGVLIVAGACSDDNGEPAAPATTASPPRAPVPEPRTEVAGAACGDGAVVLSGLTASGAPSARVDHYDPVANAWRRGAELPVALHHAGVACLNQRVYVAGGYTNDPNGAWQAQRAVYSIGPGQAAWQPEPNLREPRGALGLAAVDGRLVAVGGEAAGADRTTTEVFLPGQRAWQPGPALREPRQHLAVAAVGSRVYAIAGRQTGREGNLASVEVLDVSAPRTAWAPAPSLNDSRSGIGAATVGRRVCVTGGESSTETIGSIECLAGSRWRRVGMLARPRHGLAVFAIGRSLHVVGGGPRPGLTVSDAHESISL